MDIFTEEDTVHDLDNEEREKEGEEMRKRGRWISQRQGHVQSCRPGSGVDDQTSPLLCFTIPRASIEAGWCVAHISSLWRCCPARFSGLLRHTSIDFHIIIRPQPRRFSF